MSRSDSYEDTGQHGDGLCRIIHIFQEDYPGVHFEHALCKCGLTLWPREHHCPMYFGCLRQGRFQPNLKAVSVYKTLTRSKASI